jgi:protein-S-isoprenylcysteine O-methyltransferase Ste14
MEYKRLVIHAIVRIVLGILFFSAFFFGTAGTWNWPEAWLLIAIQFAVSIAMSIWLLQYNPELMRDRLTFMKKSAKGWDKIFIIATIPLFLGLLIIPGLDAVRFQWSSLPFEVKIIGFIVMAAGWFLIFLVMKENTYLSRVVEIQEDKGHTVVTTGPYKVVRHPMYAGVIAIIFAIPLALGSVYGLFLALLMSIAFFIRTNLEDRTLREELPGYKEYVQKTKYRLLPGIW